MGTRDLRVKFTGDASGLEAASKEAEGTLSKFKDSATKLANVAGLAAGGALALGLNDAMENQQTLANFKASVGDVAWSEAAGKAAGNLYGNAYGESLADTTAAVRGVFSAGLLKDDATGDQIESLTGKALSLAQAFEQEVGPLAIAAGQMMKTGMAANAEEAFDIITKGFQLGVDKSEDFLDTLNEYGTQFRKVGIDGQEATGLLSQGLQAGARDADIVADAIKEFSLRSVGALETMNSKGVAVLTPLGQAYLNVGYSSKEMYEAQERIAAGGEGANAELDRILDNLRVMKDPMNQAATATSLFGTQAEDLGAALFALDPSEAAKALGDFEGAAAKVDATVGDTAAGSLTAMTRQLRQELSNALMVVLPYVQQLTAFIRENKAVVVPLVAVLAGFAATVWIANAAVTAYKATQAAITAVTRVWAIAQLNLNMATYAFPGVFIVAAIVALIAVIVLIATKTTWFQDLWKAAWSGIKSAVSSVFNWVQSNWPLILAILTGPIGVAVLAITKNFDRIKDAASGIKDAIVRMFSGLGDIITAPIRWAIDAVRSAWNNTVGGKGWDKVSIPFAPDLPGFRIPMLADGGTARAGMAHIVGERGPELFVPGRTGTVVPNHELGGGAGYVVEIHGRGDGAVLEALIEKVVVRRDRATKTAVMAGSRRAFA